jgi:hypothetical protein
VISSREFKFEMESLVYFKIHEVWEKVPITKVAPNHIFSLQEFSRVFITLLSIFLAMRIDFGVYLKSENPFAWGPLVSCNLGRFLLPLATRGNTVRHLLPHAGIKPSERPTGRRAAVRTSLPSGALRAAAIAASTFVATISLLAPNFRPHMSQSSEATGVTFATEQRHLTTTVELERLHKRQPNLHIAVSITDESANVT